MAEYTMPGGVRAFTRDRRGDGERRNVTRGVTYLAGHLGDADARGAGAGGENLFGEMLGGVSAWRGFSQVWRRGGRREGLAAAPQNRAMGLLREPH